MSINADFSQRVVIHTAEQAWQPSPQAGVERISDALADPVIAAKVEAALEETSALLVEKHELPTLPKHLGELRQP